MWSSVTLPFPVIVRSRDIHSSTRRAPEDSSRVSPGNRTGRKSVSIGPLPSFVIPVVNTSGCEPNTMKDGRFVILKLTPSLETGRSKRSTITSVSPGVL